MKFCISLLSIIFVISVPRAEFGYLGGLIDIPVATPPEETFVSVIPSASFALGDASHSAAMDVAVSISIAGRGEVTLSAFTLKNYALNTKLSFLEEKEFVPALAIGIDNITYTEWISSVGGESTIGFEDDLGYAGERPKEAFSIFLAATKNIEDFEMPLSATIGIGRGKFVGRGPLSKYTNSDVFFDTTHSAVFGIFGGLALELTPNLSAIIEYDGRDGNVGLRYDLQHFTFNAAFTHLEQLRSEGTIASRIALGVALKSTILAPEKKGFIAGRVFDTYSKTAIGATIVLSGTELDPMFVKGDYRIELTPGIYRLHVTSEDYLGKKFKVTVRSDDEVKLDIPMLHLAKNDSLTLHLRMGEALMNEGNLRLARDEFTRVLEIYPEHTIARRYQLELDEKIAQLIVEHRRLAVDYHYEDLLEEAISEWEKVLELNPFDQEATDSIEMLRRESAEKQVTPTKIETKPEVTPKRKQPERPKLSREEVEDMYDKALVHYFNEEYERALEMFQKILEADPGHSKAKKYLERTKRILGL